MKFTFTDHAKHRIRERRLTQKEVKMHLADPDTIAQSMKNPNRFLIKKIYFHRTFKKRHLLMAVCERENGVYLVITVIDTSKISKYS